MTSLLFALLLLFGLGAGSSPSPPDPVPTCSGAGTAAAPSTCGPPALRRIVIGRSGGIAGQAYQEYAVTDAAVLAKMGRALPTILPAPVRTQTLCSDCFEYRVTIDRADGERRVYEFDESAVPPFLVPVLNIPH